MPAALDVDREQVRMLVLAVGVREAARQIGIQECTVQQWSARYGWIRNAQAAAAEAVKALPPTMKKQVVTNVTKPADALANTLKERGEHTKLGLSLFTARAARAASRLPKSQLLAQAQQVKAVADVAAKVWPEQSGMTLRISATQSPVIDIEAEVIEQGSAQEPQQ